MEHLTTSAKQSQKSDYAKHITKGLLTMALVCIPANFNHITQTIKQTIKEKVKQYNPEYHFKKHFSHITVKNGKLHITLSDSIHNIIPEWMAQDIKSNPKNKAQEAIPITQELYQLVKSKRTTSQHKDSK